MDIVEMIDKEIVFHQDSTKNIFGMLVAMSYFCWMNNTKVRHILYYNYIHGKLSLHQLCDPRHTHIDLRNLIPGGEIYHTCYRKIKDRLKCFHGGFCL